ncbi:MAG TPA: chloride channel protein [Polyangia bacterium]|nr:chloride channel protein [Polyangia bacterium]
MTKGSSAIKSAVGAGATWLAVGAAAGLFAIAFRIADQLLFVHAYGRPDVVRAFGALPALARLLIPAAGGAIAAGLAARARRGSGTGEIIAAVASPGARVPMGATLVNAAATFTAISTGGSLGREGPLLHFGAAAGSALEPRAGEARSHPLIVAGTAAGFAAAYNTPFAAVLFVVEVIAGSAALELVLPAIVTTTVATAVSRWAMGGGPLYGLRTFSMQARSELFAYAALGLCAGLLGPAFMALLDAGRRAFRLIPVPPAARGALGGLLVGACALRFPEVTGNGYEVIQPMLDAAYGVPMLALLLVVKAAGTTASVGSGSPGGVFTPSLFLGAAMGGLVGAAVQALWHTQHSPGGFVLVGMATMIASTTHAPLMASVLAFELSGDYAIVLPLFIANALAALASRAAHPKTIYQRQ